MSISPKPSLVKYADPAIVSRNPDKRTPGMHGKVFSVMNSIFHTAGLTSIEE